MKQTPPMYMCIICLKDSTRLRGKTGAPSYSCLTSTLYMYTLVRELWAGCLPGSQLTQATAEIYTWNMSVRPAALPQILANTSVMRDTRALASHTHMTRVAGWVGPTRKPQDAPATNRLAQRTRGLWAKSVLYEKELVVSCVASFHFFHVFPQLLHTHAY
jgi:hypothetical protein